MIEKSKCSCIVNGEFLFAIDYRSNYLIYTDFSKWVTSIHNRPLEQYEIKISNETQTKSYLVNVDKSTIIKYEDLFGSILNCNCLSILTITAEICGEPFVQYIAYTEPFQKAFEKLLIERRVEEALKLFSYIETLKAQVINDLIPQAMETHKLIIAYLKMIKCSCVLAQK